MKDMTQDYRKRALNYLGNQAKRLMGQNAHNHWNELQELEIAFQQIAQEARREAIVEFKPKLETVYSELSVTMAKALQEARREENEACVQIADDCSCIYPGGCGCIKIRKAIWGFMMASAVSLVGEMLAYLKKKQMGKK